MSRRRILASAAVLPLLWCLSAGADSGPAGGNGLSEAGVYTLDSSGLIAPICPYPGNTGPTYSVGAYPLAPTPLRRGKGQELVESYCSICHSVTLISAQPRFPAEIWKKEVEKMIHLGAPIPPELAAQIVDYLQQNYGLMPNKEDPPRDPATKPAP
ncbi:exported protein of unknown function [Methylacidimicrobium sp. AP8]|uniref:cytochrome C n=1 Tax=Methylacidimicrobium sp. AP8 TaxID=2730359 RepID=UPI0018C06070|nr:cytochrome C [Methylacidimicrobium sp. AP8]CAB4243873.1 exported protein of unknown function [Methylacidimicrobium sp. AP8]